ncbi:MAG: MBL fold metallo-hydrolase [Faecalibacterium sp.]
MELFKSARGQVMPGPTRKLSREDFAQRSDTAVTWLGNAGVLLNSRGTTLMIDPLLQDFDMPLLIEMPILPRQVPHLDGLLITHIDNDHFSRSGCVDVKDVCGSYHAPQYVAEQITALGLPGTGHDIGDKFTVGNVTATLTPAKHDWQNGSKKWGYRHWEEKDYCGYWFDTPDGSIWLPGDSRLLPSHLEMPQPDMILLDFSDNEWHITFEGAVRLANTYPEAKLLCIHWGSVDAPDWSTFNGDPAALAAHVVNPGRVLAPAPGESVLL